MIKKTCQISLLLCPYASLNGIVYECNHDYYCDYQLPRDSREEEIDLTERIYYPSKIEYIEEDKKISVIGLLKGIAVLMILILLILIAVFLI